MLLGIKRELEQREVPWALVGGQDTRRYLNALTAIHKFAGASL